MTPRYFQKLERLLVLLDVPPCSAVVRIAIGLCILPVFYAISTSHSPIAIIVFFLAVLIALRVGPALLRQLLPFSPDARTTWSDRRILAKRFDSYQWQKLFWIGIGVAAYGFLPGEHRSAEFPFAVSCLGSGGVGLFIWRRVRPVDPASNPRI